MHKTNDVEKVRERESEGERERERRGGCTEGRNGPVCISALLSLREGFIKKSVSRAQRNLYARTCVCAHRSVHIFIV